VTGVAVSGIAVAVLGIAVVAGPHPSLDDTGPAHLGQEKTQLGVDAALDGKIAAADASEADLQRLLSESRPAEIIVSPIGGQGCIFGRGNQPISPEVIRKVGVRTCA